MATYILLHGAGGRASFWDLVRPELEARGHHVLAVDLPVDDDTAGLSAYTDAVLAAVGEPPRDLVVVAQSLAGFIAPLVAARIPVDLLVLVAAMVPAPGETGADWWANTGHGAAYAAQGLPDDSPEVVFLHDVPPAALAGSEPPRNQSARIFEDPWPLAAWPAVPTRFVLCTQDRFFPAGWLRGVVRDRLGTTPDELDAGHCPFLSRPTELAGLLHRCWEERTSAPRR
jgi:hypothetical protein